MSQKRALPGSMVSGWLPVLLACILGVSQCQADGDGITLVCFGDSLTDSHHYFDSYGQPAPDLYYRGSFTNAPGCWAEQLESYAKGVKVVNYAYGGAFACNYFDLTQNNNTDNSTDNSTYNSTYNSTDNSTNNSTDNSTNNSTDVPYLDSQITNYYQDMTSATSSSSSSSSSKGPWYARQQKQDHRDDQPAAYVTSHIPVIWIGHQDLELMLSLPVDEAEQVPVRLVECIMSSCAKLLGMGHKTIIIGTLAPMEFSPMAQEADVTQDLHVIIDIINKHIRKGVSALQKQHRDRRVLLWDVNPVMTYTIKHPRRYGFKRGSPASCLVGGDALAGTYPTSVCQKPDAYFWYDSKNPSARGHQAIMNSMLYRLLSAGYTRPKNPGRFSYWYRH